MINPYPCTFAHALDACPSMSSHHCREIRFIRPETVELLTGEATAMQKLLREIRELCVQIAQQNRKRHSIHTEQNRVTFFPRSSFRSNVQTTRDIRYQPGISVFY